MVTQLQTAYRFDRYGYYRGEDKVMIDGAGKVILPPDDTLIKPELKAGYWAKFDKDNGVWVYEKIPTTCQEVIDKEMSVVANAPEPHCRELIDLFATLVEAEKDVYRLKTDSETLVQTIELIPEPTPEEKERQEQQEEKAELDRKIADIRERLADAMLLGDDAWVAELQAAYKELIGE